jgi:hypothetical protein
MFDIDLKPVFTTTVKIIAPGGQEQSFEGTFEALDIDAFESFDLATGAGARAFLERVLLKVNDIIDGQGNPVPDSPELRAKLINKSWVRGPAVKAYILGQRGGQAGN